MATLSFIKIGKPAFGEYEGLVNTYIERIKHFVNCSSRLIKEAEPRQSVAKVKDALGLRSAKQKTRSLPVIICLDERGESISSVELATKLRGLIESSKDVVFVIGGPYGIDPELIQMAHSKWCLSRSTLTSDMAWLISVEQVYRALTIMNNQPYHHA